MSNAARDRILGRLRQSTPGPKAPVSDFSIMEERQWSPEERTNRLVEKMGAVNTEIHQTTADDWPLKLAEVIKVKQAKNLLFAKTTWAGERIASAQQEFDFLFCDDADVNIKDLAFKAEASLTTTLGGVADAAALVLWPTPVEPRLVSLVPPIHIALLEEDKISNSFAEVIKTGDWSSNMPTNALLVAGPSKTADIEQELTYGVHGPKELVVLLIKK
ncbi:MAG: lactate utilization protein [Alphaproteobacteria bacterium]|nr:lactate utilization protein [Rhodospirillales bacterium]MCW9044921.1 lactate utilization protein [Alphaproteobacteria bacterium]